MANTSLNIPCPHPLPKREGMGGLHQMGKAYAVKIHHYDAALIREEAEALGMTRSEFMRWCSVFAAQELRFLRTGIRPEVVA